MATTEKYPGLVLGTTFVRGNGEVLVVDELVRRLATAILDLGLYDDVQSEGQRLINAVWDADLTRRLLLAAGLLADVERLVEDRPAERTLGEAMLYGLLGSDG